jgi:hypothetical protein
MGKEELLTQGPQVLVCCPELSEAQVQLANQNLKGSGLHAQSLPS